MPAALAFRYARALADLVTKPGAMTTAETVAGQLESFARALEESANLRKVLESPAVTPARKRAMVAHLARSLALSDLVRRFLMVVVDHRRVPLFAGVREAFESVMDERLGVVRAEVTSARELTPAQRQELIASLTRLTGRETRARFSVREDLVGGVVARIGSTVYDGSVRGQLQALKQRLAGVSSQ